MHAIGQSVQFGMYISVQCSAGTTPLPLFYSQLLFMAKHFIILTVHISRFDMTAKPKVLATIMTLYWLRVHVCSRCIVCASVCAVLLMAVNKPPLQLQTKNLE